MRCKHLLPLFVAAASAVIAVSCKSSEGGLISTGSGEKIALQINLNNGDKLVYDNDYMMTMNMPQQSVEVKVKMTQNVEVVEKTDIGFKAKFTVKSISMKAPNMPGGAGLDSVASQLKGTSTEISYDNLGVSLSSKTSSSNAMIQSLGSGMGAGNVGFMGLVCPNEKVGVGAEWESQVNLQKLLDNVGGMSAKLKGKSTMPVKFKLTGLETVDGKKVAVISTSTEGSLDADVTTSGNTKPISMTFKASGTLKVDIERGAILEMNHDTATDAKVGGQSILQKVNITSKLTK